MTDETETPAATLAAATDRVRLTHSALTLIGTMHGPETARALVRLSGGEVRSVETGARLAGATVSAIGEGVLILVDRGRTRRLEMPGG